MNDDLQDLDYKAPGEILKKAREDRQLTLNGVAERLLLSKHIVAAIEADDYTKNSSTGLC